MSHFKANCLTVLVALSGSLVSCCCRNQTPSSSTDKPELPSVEIIYDDIDYFVNGRAYTFDVIGRRIPSVQEFKQEHPSITVDDTSVVNNIVRLVYERDDYESFYSDTIVVEAPYGKVVFPIDKFLYVDYLIALEICRDSVTDSLLVGDEVDGSCILKTPCSRHCFDEPRIYDVVTDYIARRDTVWREKNKKLFYSGRYHVFGEHRYKF